jgi:hypothetical protein
MYTHTRTYEFYILLKFSGSGKDSDGSNFIFNPEVILSRFDSTYKFLYSILRNRLTGRIPFTYLCPEVGIVIIFRKTLSHFL